MGKRGDGCCCRPPPIPREPRSRLGDKKHCSRVGPPSCAAAQLCSSHKLLQLSELLHLVCKSTKLLVSILQASSTFHIQLSKKESTRRVSIGHEHLSPTIILAHLWHQICRKGRPFLLVREKSAKLWGRKRKFPPSLQESRQGCHAGGSESLLV